MAWVDRHQRQAGRFRAMRRTREDWKRLVAELRASGMGTTEFARKRRLSPKTLQWWAWELRDDEPTELGEFVPVDTAAALAPAFRVMEARIGAVTVRFENGWQLASSASLETSRTCELTLAVR